MDPKLSPGLCIATKCSIVDPTGSTILHECQNFGVKILVQLLLYINLISVNLNDLQMSKMVHNLTKPITKQ